MPAGWVDVCVISWLICCEKEKRSTEFRVSETRRFVWCTPSMGDADGCTVRVYTQSRSHEYKIIRNLAQMVEVRGPRARPRTFEFLRDVTSTHGGYTYSV